MIVKPANENTMNTFKEIIDNIKENWDATPNIIIDSIMIDEVMK